MHDFPWIWAMLGMFLLFWCRPGRLGVCAGRSGDGAPLHGVDRHWRRAGRTDLEAALGERDAMIAKLEERVRVLERIATDDSARLRDEIDSLR
jgi:hypothetical protein